MVEVKVYVEGGGDVDRLLRTCRAGFTAFFRSAGLSSIMPRVVACGGRGSAMDRFKTAIAQRVPDQVNLLLVDSEDPVAGSCSGATALSFLDARDHKGLTAVSAAHQCHLMVQVMETWFLADPLELRNFYGLGFVATGLQTTVLESRTKPDVYAALANATRHTKTKGEYGKGAHSFELLARIDATKVTAQCTWADRLVTTIKELKQGLPPTKP